MKGANKVKLPEEKRKASGTERVVCAHVCTSTTVEDKTFYPQSVITQEMGKTIASVHVGLVFVFASELVAQHQSEWKVGNFFQWDTNKNLIEFIS